MTKADHRIEHDSLGEVHVPSEALYGAQTQRAVDNFAISKLVMPRSFIRALGLIKAACAQVNSEGGRLDKTMSKAMQEAALEVANGLHDKQFPLDVFQTGSGTSTNMNANEVIAHLASAQLACAVHPNDHVNMGQSSNDVIPSCIHLGAALEIHDALLPALVHLTDVIEKKSATLRDVVKTGRTHLMDAVPLTMGQELSAWAKQIRQCSERIDESLKRLYELAIGGTAVGTGLNTSAQFGPEVAAVLCRLTQLPVRSSDNYFAALSCQDTAVEMSGQLKTLAVSLMKISNDLRWMNSGPLAGLGEIELAALQPGSSIMPGKVNPVIPEAVAMVCAKVIGNDVSITVAGQSGNFQLNVMLPLIAHSLLESTEILTRACLLLADKAIGSFRVNTDSINRVLELNPILATALNSRIGYEKGAEIVKRAYREKRSVLAVAKEMTELDEETLKELLNPKNFT